MNEKANGRHHDRCVNTLLYVSKAQVSFFLLINNITKTTSQDKIARASAYIFYLSAWWQHLSSRAHIKSAWWQVISWECKISSMNIVDAIAHLANMFMCNGKHLEKSLRWNLMTWRKLIENSWELTRQLDTFSVSARHSSRKRNHHSMLVDQFTVSLFIAFVGELIVSSLYKYELIKFNQFKLCRRRRRWEN